MSDTQQTRDPCYLHLERFSLLYSHYAILDTSDYYADQLFIKHQVTVRFGMEYAHPDAPYLIVFCRVRKKDEQRFLTALEELPNKMVLCGHPDYPTFCKAFIDQMERGKALLRSGKDDHESENRSAVHADEKATEGSEPKKARFVGRRQSGDPNRTGQEGV